MQPTPELIAYVREQLSAGFSQEVLRATLAQAGWQAGIIDAAFAQISTPEPTVEPTTDTPPLAQAQPQEPQHETQAAAASVDEPVMEAAQLDPVQGAGPEPTANAYQDVFGGATTEPLRQESQPREASQGEPGLPRDASPATGSESMPLQQPLHQAEMPPSYEQATMSPVEVAQEPEPAPARYAQHPVVHKTNPFVIFLEVVALALMVAIIAGLIFLIIRTGAGNDALAYTAPDWLGNVGERLREFISGLVSTS